MKPSFKHVGKDLSASIVVFFVALPLCLGIALASGAPLFSGLIAGIIGGVVVGMISGSAIGVSGPAAGLAVIVLTAIGTLGSFEKFLLAVILLMVGYKLANPALFVRMFKLDRSQFLPFIVTVIGVVFTDILVGIGLGMVVSLVIILIENYKNSHFLHICRLSA